MSSLQSAHSASPARASCPVATPPLSAALEEGAGLGWAAAVLSLGAVIANTSVILVILYGQTRIFFAMCRDGFLPEGLADVNPRYGTPAKLTIGLGILIAILAALVPLEQIVQLVNIGTLFAFVLVNIGVLVLRRTRPEMPRPTGSRSARFSRCSHRLRDLLVIDLPGSTWIRFVGWLALGALIYAIYGYRNSRIRTPTAYGVLPAEPADPTHRHE